VFRPPESFTDPDERALAEMLDQLIADADALDQRLADMQVRLRRMSEPIRPIPRVRPRRARPQLALPFPSPE